MATTCDLVDHTFTNFAPKMLIFRCNRRFSYDDIVAELSGKPKVGAGLMRLRYQLGTDMLQPGGGFVNMHLTERLLLGRDCVLPEAEAEWFKADKQLPAEREREGMESDHKGGFQ
jgi:hypothetical protein